MCIKRKVRVFKREWHKHGSGYTRVPDGTAIFHCWGCEYEEFENGPGNSSVALIERANGTVETVTPSMIEFVTQED